MQVHAHSVRSGGQLDDSIIMTIGGAHLSCPIKLEMRDSSLSSLGRKLVSLQTRLGSITGVGSWVTKIGMGKEVGVVRGRED